jgi:hypothetical protein
MTISGSDIEEFKKNLEIVAIQFLTSPQNALSLGNDSKIESIINTPKKDENESEKRQEVSRQEEVILSPIESKSLEKLMHSKRVSSPRGITSKKTPPPKATTILSDNPVMEVNSFDVGKMDPEISEEEIKGLFRDLIAINTSAAVEILGDFGVQKFGHLPSEKLQDFGKALKELIPSLKDNI